MQQKTGPGISTPGSSAPLCSAARSSSRSPCRATAGAPAPPDRRTPIASAVLDSHERPASVPDLAGIYDTAPVGLACLTPDCRYLQINQRFTEICGISVADHLGRFVRDMVPNVADEVEKIVQAILRTGEPVTGIEVNGQRADGIGADRCWLTSWHPLKGADGKVLAINVAAEEITERKRAAAQSESARQQSEERWRSVFESSTLGISLTDQSLTFLATNAAFQSMLGYTVETLSGRWEMSDQEMDEIKIDTKWGMTYNLEQLLEHAIVHILRHRRQIERLKQQKEMS